MDPRQHRESGAQAGHRPRPSRSHPRRSHRGEHSRSEIRVTKRDAVHPVELGVHMLRAIYARHRTEFTWRQGQIDRLAGTDKLRTAVEAGTIDALLMEWNADAERFTQRVKPFLLY